MENLTFRDLPVNNNATVSMKSLQFVPHFMHGQSNVSVKHRCILLTLTWI